MAQKDLMEARVLIDLYLSNDVHAPCNSVVVANKAFLKPYVEAGIVDPAPEAVSFAKSEGATVIDVATALAAVDVLEEAEVTTTEGEEHG